MGGLEPLPLTGAKKPLHFPNETLKFYRLGVVIIAPRPHVILHGNNP
jgi:hypothetical protein